MTRAKRDIIRRCVFRPYLKGRGPSFTLTMWDTLRKDDCGGWFLKYRLTMREHGKTTTLFDEASFRCSPMYSTDSDATVVGMMGFLTIRPGDASPPYFASYTPEQLDYCSLHAEALSCEVQARFCDENGRVRKGGRR